MIIQIKFQIAAPTTGRTSNTRPTTARLNTIKSNQTIHMKIEFNLIFSILFTAPTTGRTSTTRPTTARSSSSPSSSLSQPTSGFTPSSPGLMTLLLGLN